MWVAHGQDTTLENNWGDKRQRSGWREGKGSAAIPPLRNGRRRRCSGRDDKAGGRARRRRRRENRAAAVPSATLRAGGMTEWACRKSRGSPVPSATLKAGGITQRERSQPTL